MKCLPNYIKFGLVFLLFVITTSCRNIGDANITVHVWEDINDNTIQDSGEINLQGIDVQILSSSNYTLWNRSTTNIDGIVKEFAAGASCDEFLVVISVPNEYWPTTPVLREFHNCEVAEFGLRPYP
jgi:hypothetical protein